jgi:hypothetical protein
MVTSRQALWSVLGSLVLAVGLQGCATTKWTNTTTRETDVAAALAACEAQLPQETRGGASSLYVAEPFWVYVLQRCMQRQGWSPPHWQFSSQ